MVIGSRLVWIAIASVVGLLAAGFITYFAVNAGDSSGTTPTVQVTDTTPIAATPPPLTEPPAETAPATTEGSTESATEVPTTVVPTLPPPPPKPDNPADVEGGQWDNLPGGQWYRLLDCYDFYLPGGHTFSLQVIAVDPGGALIAFTEKASGASVSFRRDDLGEHNRTSDGSELGPAFDQIAATISSAC